MDVKAQKYTHMLINAHINTHIKLKNTHKKVAELVEGADCGVGEGPSLLCGLLQVPAALFCSFLMEHSSCLKGFLVWMQHFQPEGRWDSRSSALWLGRFEIRAWNGERERGNGSNASSSPRHTSVRANKVNFKYF